MFLPNYWQINWRIEEQISMVIIQHALKQKKEEETIMYMPLQLRPWSCRRKEKPIKLYLKCLKYFSVFMLLPCPTHTISKQLLEINQTRKYHLFFWIVFSWNQMEQFSIHGILNFYILITKCLKHCNIQQYEHCLTLYLMKIYLFIDFNFQRTNSYFCILQLEPKLYKCF